MSNQNEPMQLELDIPKTPEVRPGFRDADHVQSVVLRMGKSFVTALDKLCDANYRSRREIIEILVAEAYVELQENPDARIQPL